LADGVIPSAMPCQPYSRKASDHIQNFDRRGFELFSVSTCNRSGYSSIICTIKFEIKCGGEWVFLRTFDCVEFVFSFLEMEKIGDFFVDDLWEALIKLVS